MSEEGKTRVVKLKTGNYRTDADNAQTVIVDLSQIPHLSPFQELFHRHYQAVRRLCEAHRRPGLAIVAIDEQGIAASAFIAAKNDRINAAIVGRHGIADLYLEGDATLSLRHLVALIHPLDGSREVRFRLLDLRTSIAFLDENERRLEALEAEGPMFVRCGKYSLFLLPTSEDDVWPDDAASGWECIPERVYLDDAPAEPDRWIRRKLRAMWGGKQEQRDAGADDAAGDTSAPSRRAGRRTVVQTIRGPSRAQRMLLGDDEQAVARLRISSDDGTSSIVVGGSALDEGVLFGRYDRCDNEGVQVLTNGRISRVHLLLIRIAGKVYAIDTASTNGLRFGDKEVHVLPLEYGWKVEIGDKLAYLEWLRPVPGD